mmetsp:Transcript_33264/g.130965  ORF Transcript_33264/g.130965 Transcript_33264/m.130965 type:complete len:216 (-) Transcript_33264:1861-2508(-)
MLLVCALEKGGAASSVVGSMKLAMSTTRKSLRLVKMVENFKEIFLVLFRGKNKGVKLMNRLLGILAVAAEVLYFYYDHLVWLHRISVRALPKPEAVRVESRSSYWWLSNATFEFFRQLHLLSETIRTRRKERLAISNGSSGDEKRALFEFDKKNSSAVRKQVVAVVKQGSDVVTATCESNLLWFLTERQTRTIEGITGLLASFIGFYGVWLDVKI